MKKLILKTFVISIIFFGTGFLFYIIVKARSGTTATAGDKLTVAKWNELVTNLSGAQSQITTLQATNTTLQTQVNSMKWVDVALTDTALFDLNCERRYFIDLGEIDYITAIRGDKTRAFWTRPTRDFCRTIKYQEKSKIYILDSASTETLATYGVTKIQKKCQN